MSHFYGTLWGSARNPATRCGNRGGLSGHLRGWDFGVSASLSVLGGISSVRTGKLLHPGFDLISVQLTGGSNSGRTILDLGEWFRGKEGELFSASPRAHLILNAIRKETR